MSLVFINQLLFFFFIACSAAISIIYRRHIKNIFKRVGISTCIILGLIIILAVLLRLYVYPSCERWLIAEVFIDKTKMGLTENYRNFQFYRGLGFYYILDAFFVFTGPVYNNLFLLNFLAGCGLIVFVFMLSYLIFNDERVSLLSSFLFAVSPVLAIISASDSYTLMAVLFSSITLTFLFMFIRTRKFYFYVSSLFMMICTIQMRPDYIVFAFLFLATCLIYRECFRYRRIYIFTAGLLAVNVYLFWVICNYVLEIFLYDIYFTGVALDSENLLLSIVFNSARLFSGNIAGNVLSFLTADKTIVFLSFFAVAGCFYLYRKDSRKELLFLLSYFVLFFLSYSCFHREGFIYSGLKYIPSALPPVLFLAASGILFLINKAKGQRILSIILVALIAAHSIYNISLYNMNIVNEPRYQEYSYILENARDVDTGCSVIYTGRPTLFKNAFNFGYRKYIEINNTYSLEAFISENHEGCFYVYSGYYSYLEDETERITRLYNNTLFTRLSEEFEMERIIDTNMNRDGAPLQYPENGRILLYYFEND